MKATVKTTSPLTVRLWGSSKDVPAQRLDTYTPTTGDIVEVAMSGQSLVVLGRPI